jgi:hypothetical protein
MSQSHSVFRETEQVIMLYVKSQVPGHHWGHLTLTLTLTPIFKVNGLSDSETHIESL